MCENHFNIFSLHDAIEDKRPGGWICVGGVGVRKIVDIALKEIIMSENPMIYVTLNPEFRKDIISRCSDLYGSQRELGKKLNVSQQAISKWYLGIRYIPIAAMKKMAVLLEFPYEEIEKNIKEEKFDYKRTISKFSLSKILAKRLGCSEITVWNALSSKEYIPLPIILELLKIWKGKTNKEDSDTRRVLKEINRSLKFIKLNNPISKPVKALKNLSIDLCKILGAFAADGNLYLQVKVSSFSKENIEKIKGVIFGNESDKINIHFDKNRNCHFFRTSQREIISKIRNKKFPKNVWISFDYKITLREQYKESVEIFSDWFENVFGIKLNVRKSRGENEWFVVFTNKIIGRYMRNIFGFPAGKKTRTVDEPLIIKKSHYNYRKAFALGVITFDGSVSLDMRLRLMVNSKKLRDSIADILAKEFGKNNLIAGLTKRGEYYLQTKKNLPIKNMMNFVEAGTAKHKRLETFLNLHKVSLDEMEGIFHGFEGKNVKLRFMDAFNILQNKGECDVYSMQKTVKRELGTDVSTLTISRILNALSKTQFVNVDKRKQDKARSYRNIYIFSGVPNENR